MEIGPRRRRRRGKRRRRILDSNVRGILSLGCTTVPKFAACPLFLCRFSARERTRLIVRSPWEISALFNLSRCEPKRYGQKKREVTPRVGPSVDVALLGERRKLKRRYPIRLLAVSRTICSGKYRGALGSPCGLYRRRCGLSVLHFGKRSGGAFTHICYSLTRAGVRKKNWSLLKLTLICNIVYKQ